MTTPKVAPVQWKLWPPSDDSDMAWGMYAPEEAEAEKVLAVFIEEMAGLSLGDLSTDEVAEALESINFIPMRSVVARDHAFGDIPEDCEWHTEASGKRWRDTWWADRRFVDLVESAIGRKQAACAHDHVDQSGRWCDDCGLNLRRRATPEPVAST